MIFDSIEHIRNYRALGAHMGKAIEWIEGVDLASLEPKREYPLDGRDVYAFLQEYDTFHSYEKNFEGHLRYMDIQWVISGAEVMEVKLKSGDEKEEVPYDETKDIYKVRTAEEARILVREGRFALFFPWDLHKPSLSCSYDSRRVRKIVIKVRVG
ncbi:MAG: YhcH/YjgK/YiaL family protein [Rickettsiales bacterium]|jgi:YhcH/YjgK/YiaL family protein|nr:YhcH/YjgK/YiaL family protein [Rickettsiales bacterium]